LAILHKTGIKVPFILITGTVSEEFAVDVIKRGADDYILKDRLERLPSSINNVLEKFRLEKERQAFFDELVKNEKRYRALIENISDAIVLINEHAEFIYFSPSLKRLTGFALEDTQYKKVFEYVHTDDIQFCLDLFKGAGVQPGTSVSGQFRILHKDGHYIDVEGTVKNLLQDENVQAFVVNCRDITERKLAEEKLNHANWLYAFISQINQVIVHSHDADTVFKKACSIAVEFGKFKAAWIGIFDTQNIKINLINQAGLLAEDAPRFTDVPLKENGPQHNILRTGNSYICNDVQNDVELTDWKQFALLRGYGSCMILPIKKSGLTVATFNLYAHEVNFFRSAEIALLEEVTKDISFSLDIFEKGKLKLEADEKLKHNELRLKHAQAIAHLGSWELNFSTGVAIWSEEALRTHGLPPEAIEQSYESWVSFIHPDDLTRVLQITLEARAALTSTAFFYRVLRRDGTIRHVYSQSQFEFINGIVCGMYGVEHDVTETKEADEALKQSEANLRLIIDIIPQSISAKNGNGKFIFANNYHAHMYGLMPEELVNKTITETIPGNNEPGFFIQQDRLVIETGETKIIPELTFTDYTGKERIFYTTKVPYNVPGKTEKLVLAISQDITEQKVAALEKEKMTADIMKRNKDLEQFSFIVSHNLRAPVANILGLTELLQVIDPTDNEAMVMVRGIAASTKKLDNVIRDLNYALQVKHQVDENKEVVKFSAILEDIKLSVSNLLNNHDAEIISNFTAVDEMLTVKSYLYSIFLNLISNSIRYRQPAIKPIINISSAVRANFVELTFKDNGLGIDLKKKGSEVFGLYKRFHFHTDGKGMGLYMVKTHVETLGGKIMIESIVNKGTTFSIVFENI
jgi:PAS domain S-box-containing protein